MSSFTKEMIRKNSTNPQFISGYLKQVAKEKFGIDDYHVQKVPTPTKAQVEAWASAAQEAQTYVHTSTIPLSINHHHWRIDWQEEARTGRGQDLIAHWTDGEYLVEVWMDVYGHHQVSVAEVDWVHSSANEDCGCVPCLRGRG